MTGETFEKGNQVELVRTADERTSLTPGTRGEVMHVDSMGTIHVKWEGGSHLGMIPGVDHIRRLPDPAAPAGPDANRQP